MRQIILDTETTGLRIEDGHRIIEIGCLEMVDRKLTGNHFHHFINPEREVEAGALAVHGLSNEFLHNKPLFKEIVKELMDFISGAELIIHNAPFDLSFLNNELLLTRERWKAVADYCNVIDTLQLARQMHPGQRNSLDALCKRYGVDNSKRDLHGALLDAHLLAQVYLAMTGGQGSFFDAAAETRDAQTQSSGTAHTRRIQNHKLIIMRAAETELKDHELYLQLLQKQGKCIWND
ncbi:DNA polymerase III subunit epsilon [Aquicella siphonis]|uniref:DNA polymerase III subunit epsilon n=1 Tax=Aquicella siphonis TaxID=254247 RepID=A0A5E4PHE1_9COXI|nr:DNA polymerase III subunit epsilon [Aquicella siphonis]VVC75872.1 DNA polymerase III subunit epsilon [Aquicella siphonis]